VSQVSFQVWSCESKCCGVPFSCSFMLSVSERSIGHITLPRRGRKTIDMVFNGMLVSAQ
jgi:hypothetical protein